MTSGVRIGTPALTTRGMKEAEMRSIAGLIDRTLQGEDPKTIRAEVTKLARQFGMP